jgi:hypothetical protein
MPEIDVAAFLRTLPEFGQTPARVLAALAEQCEIWSFREGDLVRFPDEAPDARLWVGEGCLAAARPEEPAFYIGVREEAEPPLGHWIRGQTEGWYVRLPLSAWRSWNRAAGSSYDRIFRQSALLPVVRSLVPALFAALFVALGMVLTGLGTTVPFWALWLLPGAGITAAMIWGGLIVLEWSRSFVGLSGRSLAIRYLDLGARVTTFETMDTARVREAVMTRQGWWGLLGLAKLELETDVPGGGPGSRFFFPGLPADCPLVDALNQIPRPSSENPQQAWAAKAGRAPTLVQSARGETDLWFRRHWWFLVGRCLPWGGWCLLAAFIAAWAAGLWPRGAGVCAAIGAAAALVPLSCLVWEVWDWANDRLGVTAGHVVLLKRRPLWFGEIRQEAPLDQVEQLGVLRTGLPGLVLDFGTVTVRLGPADPLEFSGAAKPEAIRQAVLSRRTALFAGRDRQAAAARFDEVAEIVQTWDKVQKAGYFDGAKP